jgi:anti-anti-sigma factor
MSLRQLPGDDQGWPGTSAAGRPVTVSPLQDGDARVLVVSGELDLATAPRLETALRECLADRPPVLVVDLTEVTFLASAGLNALAMAYRESGRTAVRIVAGNRTVLRSLELVGLVPVFAVYPSRADALADTDRIGTEFA